MKKFIIKVVIFILPIIFLQVYTMLFYTTLKGDLFRIGYIVENSDYRYIFKEEFERDINFTNISDINLNSQSDHTVLTIGDSFSEQEASGYQNYLAANDSIKIIHFDKFLNNNPIQTLYGILNGDFFNKINVDYVILQSIERNFVKRTREVEYKKIILLDSLIKKINSHKIILNKER